MGYELIRSGGGALRHALGVLLLAWRRVVRAAGIALVVGIVITEIAGVVATRHFPPYLLTHVVALALGIVLAYCVGMMVLVDELLKGALDLVRLGLGEAEAGVRAAAIIAEREVGDVWGWAQRLVVGRDAQRTPARPRQVASFSALASARASAPDRAAPAPSGPLRTSARTLGQFPTSRGATTGAPAQADPGQLRMPPRLGTTPAPLPRQAVAPPRDETQEDIAATDAFRRTSPPSPDGAHPVRADRLPRIEWAAEGLAAGAALLQSVLAARAHQAEQAPASDQSPPPTPAPAAAALDPLPPLPLRASAPPPPAVAPEPASAAPREPIQSVPPTVPLAPGAAPLTIPLEQPFSPRAAPRPSSPVRTVPVITDEAAQVALEAAAASEGEGEGEGESTDNSADPGGETPTPTWEPPNRVIVLPATEGQMPGAQGAQSNADVWLDDEEPGSAEERGLWSRIGQALVRSTTRPLRERADDDATPDQRAP